MNVKSRSNRIFGSCILLMMAVLAVCTLTFTAAAEERDNSSYSLVIAKVFDFELPDYEGEELPEEVKEQAKDQTYTFKITGTRKEGPDTVPVDITFTLPRKGENGEKLWESEVYSSNGPFDVMVTELTDNIYIKDNNGNHYNMAGSSPDTRVLVSSRKHEVRLRNNSILTIQRPADAGDEELWYQISNRPYDEHEISSSYKSVNEVVSLKAGEEEKKLTNLCAAVYTIEQIAAPDGYQLQMGKRTEVVQGGKKGIFYINGTPGILTLTAGGTRGDNVMHYYTVDRTETEQGDTSEFVKRTVPIASGESYVLDNLPKGGYTVTESTVDAGASQLTVPQTIERTRTGKSTALTSGTDNSWKYIDLNDPNFDVDYIKMVSFGPLRNSAGNKLNSNTSYAVFRYGISSDETPTLITNIKTYARSTGYTGNLTVTMSDASKIKLNTYKRLWFTVTGLKSSTAKSIDVSWIEYDEIEPKRTFNSNGTEESVTVDERRWIRIEAPALNDPDADGADQIAYYYTIKDKDGNLIPGTTDRAGTSVKLLPGTSTELTLPAAGSYKVVETIKGNTPVGFTMEVAGHPFGTTETGRQIQVQVGGRRDITISKPAVGTPPKGSSDNRTYIFNVSGPNSFYREVEIKAGESRTISLTEGGTYTILPRNDSLGVYDLYYSDSGAVYGTASGSTGTITFTNSFSQGAYAYRYVHEYYVRDIDANGSYTYTYEGNSQITTRMGRKENETFQALDLTMEPKYNENSYRHFSEAYGWVDPMMETTSVQSDLDEELQAGIISEVNGTKTLSEDDAGDGSAGEAPDLPEETTEGAGDGEASEAPEETTEDAGDGEAPETPEETTEGADDGEAPEAPEETTEGAGDGEASEAPEETTEGAGDGEASEAPEETTEGAGDGEASEPSEETTEGAGDGEVPESPEETTEDGSDSGEPEPLSGDIMDVSESEELETSAEDTLDADTGAETEPSEETEGDTGESEEPEVSAEDTPDADTGAETEPSEETEGDTDESEEPEVSTEGTTDAGAETEPSEETEGDTDESEEPEASAEDTTDAGAESEPPEETAGDTGESEETKVSTEDTTDAGDSEKSKLSDEDDFISKSVEASRLQAEESYDHTGIIDKGTGLDSDNGTLNYAPDSEKDHVAVTTDASQIIILRYYRERQPEGKYNVIHVYYFRDENGDHWEGISGVQARNGELGVKYTGRRVDKVYDFQPAGAENPYIYTWDGRPQYGVLEQTSDTTSGNEFAGDGQVYRPNNAWTSVEGTEEGNQIIILRYYRELNKEGNYNIVHEYYTREPDENEAGEAENSVFGRIVGFLNNGSEEVLDDDSENGGAEEDILGTFTGTLDRSRDDGFVYTFEGNTKPEVLTALLGSTHTAEEDDWKLTYEGNMYTYLDEGYGIKSDDDDYSCNPDQQWAASTEQGDDVIILRYVREETPETPDDPERPEDPDNPSGDPERPEDPDNPSGDPERPEDPDNPSDDPETPEDPDNPSDDPNHPSEDSSRTPGGSGQSSDSPDSSGEITSLENGVPGTGDNSRIVIWMILTAGLLCGLIIWRFFYRKRTCQ